MAEVSQLTIYSVGKAATDKARGEKKLDVILSEVSFAQPTAVETTKTDAEVKHEGEGGQDTIQTQLGNTVEALWWNFNGIRVSPPDVKKDDDVLVLRLGDTDVYYWLDLNMANVKRLECVVFAINADPKSKIKQDLSNAYWFMMSSLDKSMHIHTSTANGEPFAWDIQLDTEKSILIVADSKGNKIYINSQEDDIGMVNSIGSKFQIVKQQMFGYAEKLINFKTDQFVVDCKTADINAATKVTLATPETLATKKLNVGTDFSYGGVGEGKGNFTAPDAVIGGITFTVHTHTEQGDGKDVSAPH